jgi:hypothetical protein
MNEIDMTNLGVVDQKQKETDFDLRQLASATPLPEAYKTPYSGEIYHQHKLPACGAHAGTYVKNIQEGRNHSPSYLWKRIKQVDGFPPEAGTSMEGIFKALKQYGVCSLDLLKNNTLDTLEKYTDAKLLTKAMDEDALKSRIGAYGYVWNPTFEQIKRNIFDFKVIIMRVEISADWWTPSWLGKDILPLKKKFAGQGGHFVVGTWFDKDTIGGLNEWGVTWGDNGTFYFKGDYVGRVTYIGTCFDYTEKAPYIFKRTLKRGMTGTDVGVLQQILKDKGYLPATHKITQNFLDKTLAAVKKFQADKKLVADGIVGKLTIAELTK